MIFSFTRLAICSSRLARLTLYGISVMTSCSRFPFICSRQSAPELDAAPTGREVVLMPSMPQMMPPVGKSGPFDVLHQLGDRDRGLVNLGADAVDDLSQIVRRHVGGHADRDAGAAVDSGWGRRRGRTEGSADARRSSGQIDGVPVHVRHQGRPRCVRRASVYRMAAGGSFSTEPKFPCRPRASPSWPTPGPCGTSVG